MTERTRQRPWQTGSRRDFLLGSSAAALGTAAGALGVLPASAETIGAVGSRAAPFALVTDTHINPDHPESNANLARVFDHLTTRDPAFVLHCGDVTDTGSRQELELYASMVPPSLRSRLRVIPGNHDQMWNADAMEGFQDVIGPMHYSFNAAGLHVIGLDPMVSQEATGHYFGRELLAWFEQDLRRAPQSLPVICFVHFPLGGKFHYVMDGDDYLRIASRYNVRGLFVGHLHRFRVHRFNGITQIVAKATKFEPTYYWMSRTATGALQVEEVTVSVTSEAQHVVVASIPLQHGPGEGLGPFEAEAVADGGDADVSVTLPRGATATAVRLQLFPQGPKATGWTECSGSGQHWSGSIDVSALPPGHHRVQVRAVADDGAFYDDNVPLDIAERGARVAWTHRMPGRIRGAIAAQDGLVVVGSIGGAVDALRPHHGRARQQWRRHLGPIYHGPVVTPDGRQVIVPSADQHLYGLDARSGRQRWRLDLGTPVLCDPTLVRVDGEPLIVVAAGATAYCVTLQGKIVWKRDNKGVFVGQVACDGKRVFLGSGDGNTRALDARTGQVLWSTSCTDGKTGGYPSLAYGPWAAHISLLDDGAVLTSTYYDLRSLDRASGAVRWISPRRGQVLYTPPVVTRRGILWFDGPSGSAFLSDPSTGEDLWTTPLFTTTRDTAPVRVGTTDTYWMVGASGTVATIDVARRRVTTELQISHRFAFSTPAIVGSGTDRVLVSGQQDGLVHGITGIPA